MAIGIDHKTRSVEMEGRLLKLQVWDTAGQEKFRTITSSYYRGAHGVALVFDLTDRSSFNDIRQWNQELKRYCCEGVDRILIGAKSDLSETRVIDAQEGWDLARELGVAYFELSSKTGTGVDEAFLQLTHNIRKRLATPRSTDEEQFVDLAKASSKKKKSKTCNIL